MFFYFLPNADKLKFEANRGVELLHAADLKHLAIKSLAADARDIRSDACWQYWENGPGQRPGVAVFPLHPIPPASVDYKPELQTFREVCGRYFIGHATGQVFAPEFLMRHDVPVKGYEMTDRNCQTWIVPVLRASGCTLPTDITFDNEGNVVEVIRKDVESLQQIGETLFKNWITDEVDLDLQQITEYALTILQQHYRVSKIEFNVLRDAGHAVLDAVFAQVVTQFAIGKDLIDELKKNESLEKITDQPGDSSNSNPG